MAKARRTTGDASTSSPDVAPDTAAVPTGGPTRATRAQAAVALLVFAVLFIAESVFVYTRQSATVDEPVHVADGYFSLARADYRVDPEHPPLLRMWAALPLLFEPVRSDASTIDATSPDRWAIVDLFNDTHRFLYRQNDADRLLFRARFMIVLLGVALGGLLFAWIDEWLGVWPACVALAMVALEPNLVAHYSVVTTDGGLTTFAFGAVYVLWRICRRGPAPLDVAWLCLFAILAVTSKYSSALLYPVVLLLLALAVFPFRRLSARRAAVIGALVLVTSYAGLWASYRFQYEPSATAGWTFALHDNPFVADKVPTLTAIVRWIDGHHLVPNVFSEGFLLGQAKSQSRFAFLAGQFSERGWWYYFPVAIAIKTPLPLLALMLWGGVMVWRRRGDDPMLPLFIVVPVVAFMAGPMQAHLNIGLRHVLTVYPFFIMLAVAGVVGVMRMPRRQAQALLGAAALVWLFEYGRVYPHVLAFFNTSIGGPANGARYLVDSNIDWGQDLIGLKAWMDEQGVPEVNLAYFGGADPEYYGIKAVYLNGGPSFAAERLGAPKLPGYVALSATIASGVYIDESRRSYYQPFHAMTPVATIGYSINVYRVERPWW